MCIAEMENSKISVYIFQALIFTWIIGKGKHFFHHYYNYLHKYKSLYNILFKLTVLNFLLLYL